MSTLLALVALASLAALMQSPALGIVVVTAAAVLTPFALVTVVVRLIAGVLQR